MFGGMLMSGLQDHKIKIENVFKDANSLKKTLDEIIPAVKDHLLSNLNQVDDDFVNKFSDGICGIYFFCCICKKECMQELWEKHLGTRTCVSPFNKTHCTKCKCIDSLDNVYPMYVGKSENIKDRLEEHWCGTNEKTTTKAMWLKQFLEHNSDISVKMSFVDFKPFGVDKLNYFICEEIEKELRNILHPIIGWQ